MFHVLASDPIFGKDAQLFYMKMNVYPNEKSEPGATEPLPLPRRDAEALLRDKRGGR